MEGKAKILFLCLLLAVLSEFSSGFFRSIRLRRKCRKGIFRVLSRRRCRKPIIPMLPTTKKPKILPPTTEATTPRPVVVLNPVMPHSSGLPYCKSRDVNAILRPTGGRTKRALSWPYECRHASILQLSGEYQFIWPIYDCCSKCSFPAFTTCVADSKNPPEWLCPSKGLHCIVGCVNKHNPAAKIDTGGLIKPSVVKPGIKPVINPDGNKPGPIKPVLSRCEKVEMENGKRCIRKLCVPLNFQP